ncbi:hypothetical protein RRF57_011898 [Xylaria bambusicola]|uniref:Uncharacterized protein n=1 Tax=Xylaria bambusicola TaxID=326684 RepID=A0AAN7ZDD5_9PEZI
MSTQDYGQNYQQQGEIHFASFYDSRGQMLPRHMRSKSAGVFQHNGYGQNISWRPPCSPAGIGLENTTNRGSKSREELLHDNLEHLRRSNEAAYYIHPRDEAIETSSDHEDEDTMTKATASPVDSPPFELPNPEDAYPAYRKGSLSVPPSVTLTELDYAPRRCKSCLGSPNSDCEYNFITTRKSDDLQTAAKAELCSECSAVAAPVPVTQPSQDANPTIPKTPTYPTEAAQTSQFTPTASVSMTTTTTAGIPVQRTWSQLLFARPGRPTRPSSAKPKSESSAIDETDWPSLGSCPGLSKNARKRNPSS